MKTNRFFLPKRRKLQKYSVYVDNIWWETLWNFSKFGKNKHTKREDFNYKISFPGKMSKIDSECVSFKGISNFEI